MTDLIFSSDLDGKKPDPEPFLQGALKLRLPPTRILFVGDSVRADMQGAHSVGMRTLLIRPRRQMWRTWLRALRHPEDDHASVDLVVRSLLDVPDALDALGLRH